MERLQTFTGSFEEDREITRRCIDIAGETAQEYAEFFSDLDLKVSDYLSFLCTLVLNHLVILKKGLSKEEVIDKIEAIEKNKVKAAIVISKHIFYPALVVFGKDSGKIGTVSAFITTLFLMEKIALINKKPEADHAA